MRLGLVVVCIVLSWDLAVCPAGEHPPGSGKTQRVFPPVAGVLRQASEILLKQDGHESYWTERALLQLGDVQIRAGDFDGALRSIRASGYDCGRNAGMADLAEELALHGSRARAFEVLRGLDTDHGWRGGDLEDGVQLRWVEHLTAFGDLGQAGKAVEQLKSKRFRAEGLRELAVAYAKSGNAARAAEQFALALDAAGSLKDEFDRARALWETAQAQLSAGNSGAAKRTMRRLVETGGLKDPRAKVAALREAAALAARTGDGSTARRLFARAIEAREALDKANQVEALKLIAVAQAGAGYTADARKTAWMIQHSEEDFAQDCPREEALCAIAVAQLKADDAEGALRTALSVEYFLQYRDDAIHEIVDYQIRKRNLKPALAAANKAPNPSRRAAAVLKVATAYARSGHLKAAADVAARIELTQRDPFPGAAADGRFSYRLPPSWGVCYDQGSAFTAASHQMAVQRAVEVAGAAMTLAQALGHRPLQSYATMFDQVLENEVIEALARAHAASGDPHDALAWAQRIGSGDKVIPKDDHSLWAVQQRVYALIGVAEGILDRSDGVPPRSAP